jgi:CSLREA domain-containing protein
MRSRQQQSWPRRSHRSSKHPLLRRRLGCERLEERRLLATIQVTSLDDTINLADGMTTLREAIFAASTVVEDAEIVFDPALFALGARSIPLTLGTLTISDSVTITGPGPDLLTIDASWSDPTPDVNQGDGISAITILDTLGVPNLEVTLRGLTVTGGDAIQGGGIYSRATLTLEDCTISDNYASSHGGGVNSGSAPLTILNSRLIRNRSEAFGGGFRSFDGDVVIAGSVFESNYAGRAGGGGSGASGEVDVTNSAFFDNYSARGGGLDWAGHESVIRDSSFAANRAAIQGGGLSMVVGSFSRPGTLEIAGTSFVGNSTEVSGAAGGGLFIATGDVSSIRLEQLTVSGNMASGDGGGMAIVAAGTVEIRSSTFTENFAAGAGGGIHSRNGAIELDHTIVAGNNAPQAPDLRVDLPGTIAVEHSLIGVNTGSTLAEAPLGAPDVDGNLIGGPVQGAIDPVLGPLTDNGGPTLWGGFKLLTHRPLAGSPTIDAGDAALEPGVGDTPEFDQRGAPFSRVVGARIDIGAVEAIGTPIVVDTLVDESDGDLSKGDLSLREAIELANAQPGADEIVFDPALFAIGPATILLAQGELRVREAISLIGPGSQWLTIDASGNDPTPELDDARGTSVLNAFFIYEVIAIGMTLTGGDAVYGGGILAGKLTLNNVVAIDNYARNSGGGAYALEIMLVDSRIVGNRAGGLGGGIMSEFALTIDRSVISENYGGLAGSGGSGGIVSRGPTTIRDSVIADNRSDKSAGGMDIYNTQSQAPLVMVNTLVRGNIGAYGGVWIRGDYGWRPSFIISMSSIVDNVAKVLGGGMYIWSSGTIENSTISRNMSATSGGGIYLNNGPQIVEIEHSTISSNLADSDSDQNGNGGGIFQFPAGTQPLIFLSHSIVAGNGKGNFETASDLALYGLDARFTFVGTAAGSNLAESPAGGADSRGNLVGGPVHGVIDPNLGPLADNGGPALPGGAKLLTHAPLAGSPVIGAGDPALVPGVGGVPEFDQRGAPYSRLTGSRVDMGALESQATGGALSGDFDLDGHVNGNDFLVWQRGLGRVGVVTIRHGDATADGDVDANDLAVWKARAGEGAEGIRGQEAGASQRGVKSQAAVVVDAVFAAGDFSGLFAGSESPSLLRGKSRPGRRGL